ncbi:MAG: hypothetical protein WCF48_00795, partial [Terriglobales bacterium]
FTASAGGYSQSAGTTTVDGTLAGAVSVTGGTILGAGTLSGNVSVGGSGTTPTIHVGDAGQAGLLKITGTYTQLSTGTMNVAIGGTKLGTQYSQLQVTGAASLGGTLSVNLINGFTPKVGTKFTILTASSLGGTTFSTQYIVINSKEYFAVSYTSTGVVLTVDAGTPPHGEDAGQATQEAKKDFDKQNGRADGRQFARMAPQAKPSRASGTYMAAVGLHRSEGSLDRTYRLPNVATWTASSTLDRPVELFKAPRVGAEGTMLRAGNYWAAPNPDRVVSPRLPVVQSWRQSEAHGTAMKRLLPTLRQR